MARGENEHETERRPPTGKSSEAGNRGQTPAFPVHQDQLGPMRADP